MDYTTEQHRLKHLDSKLLVWSFTNVPEEPIECLKFKCDHHLN